MKSKLLIYLLIFLLTTCFDSIFNTRWLYAMQNYTIFAGGVLFPLSGIFFFSIPLFYLKKQGKITLSNTSDIVSHKELFIIAFFDSTNSILQSIATPYLTVVSMSIFNRLSLIGIPIASYFILHKKYLPNHYLGIFLTIYGICISFIPQFLKHENIMNAWILLFILGIIPAIASFIYKERVLKKQPDIWWFNTWICIYQLFIGMGFLPFNILISNSNTSFGKQIEYGFVCQFAGKNLQENDHCEHAFIWFLLFNILVTVMNTLMLIIIRDGSSVLFVITNTLKTPITSFLGSFKVIAGHNRGKLTIADFFAFIILIVGSFVYNWNEEVTTPNIIFENYSDSSNEKYRALEEEEESNQNPTDIKLNLSLDKN